MSFLDSPLGERLTASLDAGKSDDITGAVAEIEAKIWGGALDSAQIDEVLETLQRHRQFPSVITIADAATAVDSITSAGRRRYCQVLIESGALHAAELACRELIEVADTASERGEALGLLGRICKQRFVLGGRPKDLLAAIDAYRFAYAGGTDLPWHGINLLALTCRATREGISVPDEVDTRSLTTTILEEVRKTDPEVRQVWHRTTEIEALLASGEDPDALDEAVAAAGQLAASRSVRAFELESLRRQLTDIWQLEPHHPLLVAIADQKLHLGARADVELPESPQQLEKIFGTALPVGYNHLMRGLHCAESVAKITDASGEPWGTGFLVKGSLIHPDFGEAPVLVTNAHVCSPEPGMGKLLPGEARAVFDVTKAVDGSGLVLSFECIWSSPPGTCDVTFLRFAGPEAVITQPIEVAQIPQPVSEGAYVYVIGHPAGGGLKFSIRGNDLLAYDTEMVKVHYTAPTEGGSSGSPVLNQAWQLMAVHHAGDSKMRRLDDPSATYQANEGITIKAIREEYERSGR